MKSGLKRYIVALFSLIVLIFLGYVLYCSPSTGRFLKKEKYDVYLLIGQSNMAGRGFLLEGDMDTIEGVYILNGNDTIEKATNPLNKYSSIRRELSLQQMSPAYGFSKAIYQKRGNKVLLVVNARGGSSMEEWMKENEDKNYYSEAVRRAKCAMKYGVLKGILWHQGEANSKNPDNYMALLSQFVKDLREDLSAPNLPFIAGEIAHWWEPYASNFNPIIRTISDYIPYSSYVSVEGCKSATNSLSDPHFDRESQILIGKRYAEKIIEADY